MREFAERFHPCTEAREWASTHCTSMRDVWDKAHPEWLVWVATQEGVLTEMQLRLFGLWAVRQIWHLVSDPRSRAAVEVSERYTVGLATIQDLEAAKEAAVAATRAAWEATGTSWDAPMAAVAAACLAWVTSVRSSAIR